MSLLTLSAFKMMVAAGTPVRKVIGRIQPSDVRDGLEFAVTGITRREQIALVRTLFAAQPVKEVLEAVAEVVTIPPLVLAALGAPRIAQARGLEKTVSAMFGKSLRDAPKRAHELGIQARSALRSIPAHRTFDATISKAAIVLDHAPDDEALEAMGILLAEAKSDAVAQAYAFVLSTLPGGRDVLEASLVETSSRSAFVILESVEDPGTFEERMCRIVHSCDPTIQEMIARSANYGTASGHFFNKKPWAGERWLATLPSILKRNSQPSLEQRGVHGALAAGIAQHHLDRPELVEWAMDHPDPAVRFHFASSLRMGGGEFAYKLAKAPQITVRRAAREDPMRFGEEWVLPIVRLSLNAREALNLARRTMSAVGSPDVLGKSQAGALISPETYRKVVEEMVNHPDPDVRVVVASPLYVDRAPLGLREIQAEAIRKLEEDPNEQVKRNARLLANKFLGEGGIL